MLCSKICPVFELFYDELKIQNAAQEIVFGELTYFYPKHQ